MLGSAHLDGSAIRPYGSCNQPDEVMRGHPIRDLHEQALRDLEGLMPVPRAKGLQWLGVFYPSVKSSLGVGSTVEWGGKLYDIKFSLTVRKDAVRGAAQPFAAGKILTYGEQDYRIIDVKEPAPGASYHLTLISPNR